MAQGGDAVGRHQGKVIFARGGIPGEVVAVRLTETRKSFARGVVETVLTPSPKRTRPRCPLFGQCGGCQWQFIDYPAQLAFKSTIVREQCRQLGHITSPTVATTIAMGHPWSYRGTTKLHLASDGQIGYYSWHSHNVVPMTNCPLLVDALNQLLSPLTGALQEVPAAERPTQVTLRYSWAEETCLVLVHGGGRRSSLLLRDLLVDHVSEIAWQCGPELYVLSGRGFIRETLGGVSLRVSPSAFFQVNVPQTQILWQMVLTMLDTGPGDHVLDAYAGVGALSLPLADRVGQITAIESHPAAVDNLRENVRRLGFASKVRALQGSVEEVLPSLDQTFDLVIVDPPRRGCRQAIPAILRGQPRRIVYVSCHPGTLARDLRDLLVGSYRLVQIQPIDLFPHTFHIESVALLERME